MNDLRRELAPVSGDAWQEIDDEARRVLKLNLAGRKLVDFSGPHGWEASAVSLGRTGKLRSGPQQGVEASVREVQPLIELRVPFELSRAELETVARGARDAKLDPLIEAATTLAAAEDGAIFHGYKEGGIAGVDQRSPHEALKISNDYAAYPGTVVEAMRTLTVSGVDGPYALALGPRCYTGLLQATGPGGYPVLEHVRKLLDGPIVRAPSVDGAFVLSVRGGDFELTVGQDVSIGYLDHTATEVRLFLVESLTFRVLTPEAAVRLAYSK